jgi:hypothetical protein
MFLGSTIHVSSTNPEGKTFFSGSTKRSSKRLFALCRVRKALTRVDLGKKFKA